MKNEWTNRLFKPKGNLTRDEIHSYGSTSDQHLKHTIEEKSLGSDFDNDALEGWSELNYDTRLMKRLDNRFKHKGRLSFYLIGSTIVILIIATFLWNNRDTESSFNQKNHQAAKVEIKDENPEIRIDESDILMPLNIEEMIEAPAQEQVHAQIFKEDFKELKQISDEGNKIIVKELPVLEPQNIQNSEPAELERIHFSAKEVYFSELKLVDYREYRSRPVVKTKQMVLTGLPANKESENSEVLDSEWTETEVPYIEYIEKSMRIFNKGNYKKALVRYQTILETYNDDVNALFYGGLCLYNLKQYDEAIVLFKSCLSGTYSNFDEEAQWMIALSAEKAGDKKLAYKYFKLIVEQNGFYSAQAKEKLK